MKIEVFGPGCSKCHRSAQVAEAFLADHGLEGEVVKQHDVATMVERGVLMTPTTMIDGEVVLEGRVLRERDLEDWLKKHAGEKS